MAEKRDENFEEGSSSHGTERVSHDEDALFKAPLINFMETFQQLAKLPKMQELLQGPTQVVSSLPLEKEDSHAEGSHDTRGKAPMVERQQVVHFALSSQFPKQQPALTLQSCLHFDNFGKPIMRTYKEYPWSPRWETPEMVQRIYDYIVEESTNFKKFCNDILQHR
ncbi:hypothetical protein L7F22_008028 [Adiantum nelumboides]|nr:hypothetical protein [Adiantum nelumboides]